MAGKKKGSNDDKISRDHWVIGHTAQEVEHLTISYDPVTGVPTIHELAPESLRSQISYEKLNGKAKVIYSIPVEDFSALNSSHLDQLKKQFDYLIAVDTNTINKPDRTQGCRISVCASSAIAEPLAAVSSDVVLHPVAAYLILDPGPIVNPEPLGWHLIISQLSLVPALNSKRIGIIVDSELGMHVEINAREKPYYGEHILPANMTLIYASSDKPEIFANQMLKHCDAMAERGIEVFMKSAPSLMSRVRGQKHGTAICVPMVQKQAKPPAA